MKKEFKGVQLEILNAKKKNQLVSAGAGSGKTTVMIEKISNLLLDNIVDIDNLLVVTFTVLAAQEMKERLVKKLKEVLLTQPEENKEKILNLIEKIDTASIDTIDGFASKTIKKYFYDLQISPNVEIISDATKDYYLTRAMQKTFSEHEKKIDELNLMLDLFGGNRRNLDNLKELILDNYYNIINIEDYEQFLADCLSEYQDSAKSENVVNAYMCEFAHNTAKLIIQEYVTYANNVKDILNPLVGELQTFDARLSFKTNLKVLMNLTKPKFTKTHYAQNEGLKSLNAKIKLFFEFKSDLIENQIDENYEEKNEKIIKYLTIFIELLKNFIKNYNNIKEKYNLIDFNDLNRLMLKLLENQNIQKELQEKYKYIFIDEYQDVNPLQDSLMTKLTGPNTTVFLVGDVKQSIYGFRGSSPEWFLEKYNRMKQNQKSEDVFDMNVNFRSSPTILEFINVVFSKLMTKEIADIDYKKDCLIEPQRDDIVDDKVKIMLVKEDAENNYADGVYSVKNHIEETTMDAKQKEAMLVLKIITELVSEKGVEFYDANSKQRRHLTYSDIAILTHSDKDESSKILVDVLKQHLIPLNVNNKLEIDESETIRLVLSILKCVALTADDVDWLATMMCLSDLTIDEIVEIRDKNFSFYENLQIIKENLIKNEIFSKILEGFECLEDIRQASYSMTNRELISYILNNKRLKYFLLKKPNGEKELNLLEEFMMKLTPLEDALGLSEFVEVVESNVNSSGDFISVDKEDSVTLQTIHKSKGLEYPVVILFNSSKLFAYIREHDAINFNSGLGLGIDYFDTLNRVKMDSLPKFAIRVANSKKGYKEELRLLYVALTRAKNKLFITGSVSENLDLNEIKKTSYTNMLLDAFKDEIVDGKLEKENFVLEITDEVDDFAVKQESEEKAFEISDLDFEYSNQNKFSIPLKNSVTGINSKYSQGVDYKIKDVVSKSTQYEIEDIATIGIHYHSALEELDLKTDYVEKKVFDDIDYNKVKLAHKVLSPLTNGAINIKKEAEFMMYVPYCEIVPSDIEDKVLIQGVADLIIEKENSIILVDYKFSSLPAKVLKQKYAEQLNLYKFAIESAYNKKVEQMYIYSINNGELI